MCRLRNAKRNIINTDSAKAVSMGVTLGIKQAEFRSRVAESEQRLLLLSRLRLLRLLVLVLGRMLCKASKVVTEKISKNCWRLGGYRKSTYLSRYRIWIKSISYHRYPLNPATNSGMIATPTTSTTTQTRTDLTSLARFMSFSS